MPVRGPAGYRWEDEAPAGRLPGPSQGTLCCLGLLARQWMRGRGCGDKQEWSGLGPQGSILFSCRMVPIYQAAPVCPAPNRTRSLPLRPPVPCPFYDRKDTCVFGHMVHAPVVLVSLSGFHISGEAKDSQ